MDVTKSERFEQLDRLLTEHDGMLQTAQVIASGIVKPIFYEYVKEKNLQQVAHGIYVSEDTWIDAMFLLHLRCGQAVFSHESALFFHDLTDREPSPYAITVRRGYSTTRLKAEGLSVYTIKPELYEVGLTTGQTPFGHTSSAHLEKSVFRSEERRVGKECLLNCYIYFCATSVYNSSTKGSDGCDQIRTV